jgi:hypothetical protein
MPRRNARFATPARPERGRRARVSARQTPKALRGRKAPPVERLVRHLRVEWAQTIPEGQWTFYRRAIVALREAGVRFILGGGFALAAYMGRWRNTKDMDLYILPEEREKAVAALNRIGFADYYSTLSYDRAWIYRATCGGVIVDLIWAMANQRAEVDEMWFRNASPATFRGENLPVVPVEELLWCKLYILQRDHSDWTDVWNLLQAAGHEVNWEHLLWRLEEDWPLLKAALTVYLWLCPEQVRRLPAWLRTRLNLLSPAIPSSSQHSHARLLDSRNWFIGVVPNNVPLEV